MTATATQFEGRAGGSPPPDAGDISHRSVLQNTAFILGARSLAILASLISVPVVIRYLGFEGYGIWESLMAVAVLAAAPQNVLGGTLLWRMSAAFGTGDREEMARLSRAGVAVTLALVAVALPLVLLGREWIVRLLQSPPAQAQAAAAILPAMLVVVLAGGVTESFAAVLRAAQRAGWVAVVQCLGSVLNATTTIVLLVQGLGLYSLLAGYVAAALFNLTVLFVAARLRGIPVSLLPALPTADDFRRSGKYAGFLALGAASASLRTETDKLVIAAFASPAWVAFYAIAARMTSLVMETSNLFYVPTIAAAGALHGRNDDAGIRRLFSQMMAVVPLAAGAVVAVIAGSSRELMVFWLGRFEPQVIPILLLLLSGTAAAVMLTGPGTAICKGIGRVDLEARYIGLSAGLNLVLTVVLVLLIGAMGTVVASAVSWVVGAVYFVWVFERHLRYPLRENLPALRALAALALAIALDWWLVPHMATGDSRLTALLAFAVNSLAVVALYAVVVRLLGQRVPFEEALRRPWVSVPAAPQDRG